MFLAVLPNWYLTIGIFALFRISPGRIPVASGWFNICEILMSYTALLLNFIGKVYLGGELFLRVVVSEALSFVSIMSNMI